MTLNGELYRLQDDDPKQLLELDGVVCLPRCWWGGRGRELRAPWSERAAHFFPLADENPAEFVQHKAE